jgi:hypothetical protein
VLVIRWVDVFVDRPRERFEQAAEFWTAVTGTRLSARRGPDQEFATLVPASGDSCWRLQAVGGSGGAHLDLSADDPAETVAAARRLGAEVIGGSGGGGGSAAGEPAGWTVLRSPAGVEFCVVPWHGEAEWPPAVQHGGGELLGPSGVHKGGSVSRLDQVCLDIPPEDFEAEVGFWWELTGWDQRRGSAEFAGLRSEPLPVQILVQRLDETRPAGAHVDLACSDREATRGWHEELGARLVARHEHWLVMEDPAGGVYCLTERTPRDPAVG